MALAEEERCATCGSGRPAERTRQGEECGDPYHAAAWDDDLDALTAALGNVRVQFWTCKVHRRGRVEWRGDVAHCLEDGCDQASTPAVR